MEGIDDESLQPGRDEVEQPEGIEEEPEYIPAAGETTEIPLAEKIKTEYTGDSIQLLEGLEDRLQGRGSWAHPARLPSDSGQESGAHRGCRGRSP